MRYRGGRGGGRLKANLVYIAVKRLLTTVACDFCSTLRSRQAKKSYTTLAVQNYIYIVQNTTVFHLSCARSCKFNLHKTM